MISSKLGDEKQPFRMLNGKSASRLALRVGGAAVLSLMAAACLEAATPQDLASEEPALIAYNGTGVFANDIYREIDTDFNVLKRFELGRIKPSTQVSATLTRYALANDALNFAIYFSPDAINWTVSAQCSQTSLPLANGSSASCAATASATDNYALVEVTLPNGGSAKVRVQDTHTGPDDAIHSNYASDTITVPSPANNGNRLAKLASGAEPGAFQFEIVDVTVTRSNANLDLENGIKLKALDSNTEIADFECPTTAGSPPAYDWTPIPNTTKAKITCHLAVAPRDGEIHVPIHLNGTVQSGRSATVVIKRSNQSSGAKYVRSELTGSNTSP